jgi:hypothetical protein
VRRSLGADQKTITKADSTGTDHKPPQPLFKSNQINLPIFRRRRHAVR